MPDPTFALHPAQADVYTDQLLNVDSPHYNIGGYIKLKGALNTKKFAEAVTAGPKYFDVFRMRFDFHQSEPACYLQESFKEMELGTIDFSNHQEPEKRSHELDEATVQHRFCFVKKQPSF